MLDNLRKRAAQALLPQSAKSGNPFAVLSTQAPDVPVYTDLTVRKATREGYKISGSVYRSVRVVVQAASGIPWVVLDKDGEIIPDHDFTKVWSHPNKEFSGQDNMELLVAHLKLVGNAFIQPIIVRGRPTEFWVCMPDLIKPIPSDVVGEWLKGYQVSSITGSQYNVPSDQFVHFMQFDPGNPYWGMGDLMAAARTVDTDNEAQDTQKITMQNRGTPDGVFEAEQITPEQREESERAIEERYLNKSKRRRPWIVAGMKWQQMSLTPIEMDFIKSRLQNKRDIASTFGVDPWFLGDNEHSSYNNILEAKKALYEEAVIPLLDDIKSTLNLKVAPFYGKDITISYDTSKIIALREDYTKKAEQAKTFWAMGVPFEQINERLELGFEEFEGWDRGYLPFSLAPVGSAPPDEEPKGMMTKALNLETEEQKTYHWKRIDRRRVAWWAVVSKKIEPLYKDEAKAIAKATEGKKPEDLVEAAEKAIKAGRSEWEKVLTAISAALIEDFGDEIAEDLGGEKSEERKWAFDPMSAASRAWIVKNGAKSITTILTTNLDDVKRVIIAGTDENVGTAKIARNLRQFYTDRSPFKAMRVARTEVSHAAGFGQREAARQSGIVKSHIWITSRDDRVRDTHVIMDKDEVAFDKPYGDGSMYPGEQDIMCRCVESFGTKEVVAEEERFIPAEEFGDIPDDAGAEAGSAWDNSPKGSTMNIKKIELHAEKGEWVEFDGGGWTIGEHNASLGRIRIFDVGGYSKGKIDALLGHEFGHSGYQQIPGAIRREFVKATLKEKPWSKYASDWFGKVKLTGVNENFAETHRIFVARDKVGLALIRTTKPRTFKVFVKAWKNLGGEVWW